MELTHFNESGKAHMVDVTIKPDTHRQAIAAGRVVMKPHTLELIKQGVMGKGDVLGVAQVAGIMGAKKTGDLIPMCHPILLSSVNLELTICEEKNCIDIIATVKTTGKTGVEMEALTAVSIAALTIYDMCKAADKAMVIEYICLTAKSGGKSGDYQREEVGP